MTRAPMILVIGIMCLGCNKSDQGISAEQSAAYEQTIVEVRAQVNARLEAWRTEMSAAMETVPVLGDKCPVTDYYPVKYFDLDAWQGVRLHESIDKALPALAKKANDILSFQEKELARPESVMLDYYGEKLKHFASDSYWDHDLTLFEEDLNVPEQGNAGTPTGGTLLVRAFLYSHKDKRVICEGLYQVGTGDSIKIEFDLYGTQREIDEQRKRIKNNKLNSKALAMAVLLDLWKSAYYSANSHLRTVTDRAPIESGPGDPAAGAPSDDLKE